MVVAHQQRAVGHDQHVHGPSPLGTVRLQPAAGEHFVVHDIAALQSGHGHAVAHGVRAVPGAVLGDEDLAAVLRGEHLARIELHAQRRRMGRDLQLGRLETRALALPVGLLGNLVGHAYGKAVVQARLGRAVERVGRRGVAGSVAAVAGEPQVVGSGMEVEADRVADAASVDLQAAPVGPHAHDGRVRVGPLAHVTRRAHGHIEPAVRIEGDVLPAVPFVLGKRVVDHHGRWRVVQARLDLVEAQHPADLCHVERAVAEGHSVGLIQTLGEGVHGVRLVVPVMVDHRIDLVLAGADENRPGLAQGQRARLGHAGVDADAEAGGQRDPVQRKHVVLGQGAHGQTEQESAKRGQGGWGFGGLHGLLRAG